jgi:hypothetical protein
MAKSKSRGKKYVPKKVCQATVMFSLDAYKPLTDSMIDRIDGQARDAFNRLRSGNGIENDTALIIIVLERLALSRDLIEQNIDSHIADAWFSLDRADDRLIKHGLCVLDGDGIASIEILLDIAKQLLQITNRKEMMKVIDGAKHNFLTKQWQSAKIATNVEESRLLLQALNKQGVN